MGIISKKWTKRDILKEFKDRLDEIVKGSEKNVKQFCKNHKGMMIEHELFIQEYAKEHGDQDMLNESLKRFAIIQTW